MMRFPVNFKCCGTLLNTERPAFITVSDYEIFNRDFDFCGIDGELSNLRPIYDKATQKFLHFEASFSFYVDSTPISIVVGFDVNYEFPNDIDPFYPISPVVPVTVDLSHKAFLYRFDDADCTIVFQFSRMKVRD